MAAANRFPAVDRANALRFPGAAHQRRLALLDSSCARQPQRGQRRTSKTSCDMLAASTPHNPHVLDPLLCFPDRDAKPAFWCSQRRQVELHYCAAYDDVARRK